jgi:hypothetical protein
MAKADAWRAPGGWNFAGLRGSGATNTPPGNARFIAAPAYKRLLAAEPYLRRSIPALDHHLPAGHRGRPGHVADGDEGRQRARVQGHAGLAAAQLSASLTSATAEAARKPTTRKRSPRTSPARPVSATNTASSSPILASSSWRPPAP